jgi:hypothetical protein
VVVRTLSGHNALPLADMFPVLRLGVVGDCD